MPARIVALEGIDQSGKRTQTMRLARRLAGLGFAVRIVSFPVYTSLSGRLIKSFLRGERKYPTEALHMLYSLNRWENQSLIKGLMAKTDFLIADRYTPSNIAYGVAKGLSMKWLVDLDEGLPKSDLVIILDVPVASSFARKKDWRDTHEKDSKLLARVNSSYRRLGKRLGWKSIDATSSADEVEAAVWKTVQQRFKITSKQ